MSKARSAVLEITRAGRARWICLICAAICNPLAAIDRDRRLDQLDHTSWTSKDGAPSHARSIVQTTDGFLWFGGQTGLYRFDGLRFERYEMVSGVRLPKTDVASLLALPDGGLLIGWSLGGVSLLKNGQVADYSGPGSGFPEGGQVEWFRQWPAGVIWGEMSYRGAYRLDADGHWHEFGAEGPLPGTLSLLWFDRQGGMWVGNDKTTFFRPPGEKKFNEIPTGVQSITETPDGLWWAIEHGSIRPIVHKMLGASILPSQGHWFPEDVIFADSQGSLWGSRRSEGLFRIAYPERAVTGKQIPLETFTSSDGLTNDHVGQIFQDREENIWVTTPKGVDRFRQSNVVTVKFPQSSQYTFLDNPENSVRVITTIPRSVMSITDGAVAKIRPWPFGMFYVYHGKQGITWLGTNHQGIVKSVNDGFEPIDTPGPAVGSITEDEKGGLWAIIAGKGAFHLENGKWISLVELGGPPGSHSAFTDSLGRVWLGSFANRVVLVDRGKIRLFAEKDGINTGSVLDIREIAGAIFIGGDRGLAMFDGKQFVPVIPNDTESFRNLWALLASEQSGLWFAEARGLAHIPIQELRTVRTNPKHAVSYEVFDVHDGLSEDLQRSGVRPASIESSDGRVWFATQTSIVWVDPKRIVRNRVAPNVSIDSLAADGKTYHFFSRFTLPPRTTGVRIAFTATSLSIPERVRFRYWLEGVDKHWQDAGTRREVSYTNLRPGAYRFRVIACNNDGVWNETGGVVSFGIAPTFYQTTWFSLALVLSAVLLLWAALRWRMRRVAASLNDRFQERLDERIRLARDFHDTLLQTIQGSKMVADSALSQNADLPQMRSTMERLSEWLGRAVHEGRSALSSLRSSISEGNELAEALRRAGEEYRFKHPMELNLVVEGEGKAMHPIVRDEVYRIGYEAVRNAFTHSGGARVDVELSYVSDLVLRVRDDGRGIDAGVGQREKEGHFGMIGMHERAARIGAKLTISTSPTGTELELRVPRSIVFQGSTPGSKSTFKRLKNLL